MAERNQVVYVTADSSGWLLIDFPFGLISPPTLELHQPLAGTVTFFWAELHRLKIPDEAKRAMQEQS